MGAGGRTILVVDDEELIRSLTRRVLLSKGYTVLEAADGDEALRLCAQHAERIQLVVTDIMMPETNGFALARQLVSLCPQLRVLYMSGYADEDVVAQNRVSIESAFLRKPIVIGDLVSKVQEMLNVPAQ